MTEKDITKLLQGQFLNQKALAHKLEAVTTQQKTEMENLLEHLKFQGIIGIHDDSYYLIAEQGIKLAKVSLKKRNFVVLRPIPDGDEIKISGAEADGLLLGDLIYVKEAQGFYHGIDYLKPVESFKGRYSLTASGKQQLLVDYLNQCGKTVLISSVDESIKDTINQGDLVIGQIQSYSNNVYTVAVSRILVKADKVGSDISMIITSNDAPIDFPEEVLAQAKSIPTELKQEDYLERTDLREETIVTIDGNDSHDFDDAVSVKKCGSGYEVSVHIADVTHYVRPSSPLDDEAVFRGTSIYVADRVVPMLPFELSNGICSLNPGVDRVCLTVVMKVDGMGNVFSSNVFKSVIRSHGRLTYDGVNNFFEGKDVDYSDDIKQTLSLLHDCSKAIRRRRELQGSMKLSSTEIKFKLDENGQPTDLTKEVQGESEKMIEDLMVIANCEIAKLLKSHHIPVLYRIHEQPPLQKLINFRDFIKKMNPKLLASFPKTEDITGSRLNDFLASIEDENLRSVISYMMLRALAKAKYSPEEKGHFGLAEPFYCHFTSPIRRYPDDIIHRLVKDYLIDEKPFEYDDVFAYLQMMGDRTSASEARADIISRKVDDLESAKYMTQHIGEVYHGKITGMVLRGMFIETEIGIEGFLAYHCMHGDVFNFDDKSYSVVGKHHPELSFTIGTPIDIAVLASNPDKLEIDFSTPEFYKANAVSLSEAEREDLSLNGLRVYEEDEDFVSMTGRARFSDRRGGYGYDRYDRNTGDSTGDNGETSMERKHSGSGYDSSERGRDDRRGSFGSRDGGSRSGGFGRGGSRGSYGSRDGGSRFGSRDNRRPFGRDDDKPKASFDSQTVPEQERRFDDRKPQRKTYSDHQGYSAPREEYGDDGFERRDRRPSYSDRGGDRRSSYSDRGSSDRRGSYGSRDGGFSRGGSRGSYGHSDRGGDRRSSYSDRGSSDRRSGGFRGRSSGHNDR